MGRSGESTKMRILDSLCVLVSEHPADSISAADIAERTGITRQTFYYHFDSPLDVYFWAVRNRIEHTISPYRPKNRLPAALQYFVQICNAMRSYRDLTKSFMDAYPQPILDRILAQMDPIIRTDMEDMLNGLVSHDVIDFLAIIQSRGYIGIIEKWVSEGMEGDPLDTVHTLFETYPAVLSQTANERIRSRVV